ncbi:MAG: alginate lyase family protein [Promethearchaeota archaeon]
MREKFFSRNLFAYSNDIEYEDLIENLNTYCSDSIKGFLKYADDILNRTFNIYEKDYTFDRKINWHYSFFNNYIWELKRSDKINIHPQNKNIDVKYVWEFNRHQYLTYLGFAFYFTKDEKFAIKFKNLILNWIKENPPLYGINWISGLEISIRLISWIFTLFFFKNSKEINNNVFFRKIFNSMFQHAYYLRYFYMRRSFNHTIGDLTGLYLFSKIFMDIRPIKKWERFSFKKLIKQIHLQVRDDGTNIEQSVNYHKFVLEFFTIFLILNLNRLNKNTILLIEKMVEYLVYIIKPNNSLPLIGDIDNGKVLLLTYYNNNSYIDLINLGSILFERQDFKSVSKSISPISLLFLGDKGLKIFNALKYKEPKEKVKYFDKGGFVVIRDNWNEYASYLFIDMGRFGPQNAAHSHSSITNFIYTSKGKDIIIDSGTYTYNKSWNERNIFRGSKAHNVVEIDHQNQAKINEWFSWKKKPKVNRRMDYKNNKIKAKCSHDGYEGFIVKRIIDTNEDLREITIRDVILLVQDSLINQKHDIKIYFHFNEEVIIKQKNNKIMIDEDIIFEVDASHKYNIFIQKSEYSPRYGFICNNHTLIIHLESFFLETNKIEVETKIKLKSQ